MAYASHERYTIYMWTSLKRLPTNRALAPSIQQINDSTTQPSAAVKKKNPDFPKEAGAKGN